MQSLLQISLESHIVYLLKWNLFSVLRGTLKSAMRVSCTQNMQLAKQRCDGNVLNDQKVVAGVLWWLTCKELEHPEPGQAYNHPVDQAQIHLAKVLIQKKDQAARTRNISDLPWEGEPLWWWHTLPSTLCQQLQAHHA